jgi:small subunit ribosomal protein S1
MRHINMTESFAELFQESLANQRFRPGQILNALVIEVGQDYVIVNAGLKSEAVISIDQFKNEKGELEVKAGDEVEVALDSVEDGSGETRLSREKAKRARTWTRLETAFNEQQVVTGIINGRVKGGFTVEIENVRAFLPGSLVDVRPVRDPSYLEGKVLEFKVIKLDQKRNNVVVSRRAVVEQEYSARRCSTTCRKARSSRARSRTSPTTARSSTSAASTACCTSPTWRGSASSTPPRWSRSATRSTCAS